MNLLQKKKIHDNITHIKQTRAKLKKYGKIIILDELIAFLKVAGETGLEKYGVDSELCVEEGHVTIDTGELCHADVTFLEMSVVRGERIRATGATECPTRCHL